MLALWLAVQQPTFDFQVDQGKGLTISALGVPIVRSSWFQYYSEGWAKGYYSSTYGAQQVSRIDADTVKVTFSSLSGAHGDVTYHRNASKLDVHYNFLWDGETPANVEVSAAMIWAPALEAGKLTADGKATRSLSSYAYDSSEIGSRRFSPDATSYTFTAPLGLVSEKSSIPLTLFDARGGYKQDWAKDAPSWWLGDLDLPVSKDKPASLDVEWTVGPASVVGVGSLSKTLRATPAPEVLMPDTSKPPMIPKPRLNQMDWTHPMELTNAYSFPAGLFQFFDVYRAAIARRFVLPPVKSTTPKIAFDAGVSKLGFTPGGYRVTITDKSITVLGEEEEGLRDGLERVASLAFIDKGKLWLPTGTILDQPKTEWRGAHLFVGPEAPAFQAELWQKVLRPLGFNKVVLQCERTDWDSLPGIHGSGFMSKPQLVGLFDMYRRMGVEPIPLIQSYGHMEWFFNNGKNLDVAMNPKEPYAVDPRNPKTQELLTKLWDEAIATLKPETIHFGLDEVDMTGVKEDPPLETQLWQTQLSFLGDLAKSHKVKMMLWGDQALAPGEAPDATNGDTKEDAAARRAAIPRGSLIGDWHYIGDPAPSSYSKNIDLWKSAGMRPIASTWFDPKNIAGFYSAAGAEGIGTLQTTWSGYESNEEALLGSIAQYSAFVLAADYGWSGRTDPVDTLSYDPALVFRKMFFGMPSGLVPLPGTDVGDGGKGFQIGQIQYGASLDLGLSSVLRAPEVAARGSSFTLVVNAKGRELALAMTTDVATTEGTPVAKLTVTLASGKTIVKQIVYGRQVRAADDKGPLSLSDRGENGVCSYVIHLGSSEQRIKGISFKPLNTYTGLKVWGVELVN